MYTKNKSPKPESAESARQRHTMDQIRAGREMEVDLKQTIFTEIPGLPKKNNWLKLWLSLHRTGVPVLTDFARSRLRPHVLCDHAYIESGFRCLYGNIICDSNVGLHDTYFVDYANVYIGKSSAFSFQNIVITSSHDLHNMKTVLASEIVIGENVWITSRAVILRGVRIGRNSVIGAGSVVSRDIPPNVFAAGNPAKPIKTIDRGTKA